MSEEVKRRVLEARYEEVIGKKPRKNMKTETIKNRISEALAEQPKENTAITDKMSELIEFSKSESDDGVAVAFLMVLGKNGVHMAMSGQPQDVAVMLSTGMKSHQLVDAVVSHSAMMSQMRKQQEKAELEANAALEKPQTEA